MPLGSKALSTIDGHFAERYSATAEQTVQVVEKKLESEWRAPAMLVPLCPA
jgi:hypothetical protein